MVPWTASSLAPSSEPCSTAPFAMVGVAPLAVKRLVPSAVRTDVSEKVEDADPTDDGAAVRSGDGDAAVWRDANVAGGDGDGLLLRVENGLALAGLEDSGGGAGEGSVACVRMPLCGLNGEEACALNGEVERIAGGLELALAEIETVAAEDAEVVDGCRRPETRCRGPGRGRPARTPLK